MFVLKNVSAVNIAEDKMVFDIPTIRNFVSFII